MQSNQRDNDLQRAIDEITKKTATAAAPKPVSGPAPQQASAPVSTPAPAAGMPPVASATPAPAPQAPVKPVAAPAPATPKLVAPEPPKPAENANPKVPEFPKAPEVKAPEISRPSVKKSGSNDIAAVKEAALKELFPLMDKISVDANKKYSLYKDMIETIDNKEVYAPALEAAKGLRDKTDRANALLFVINSIDESEN